MRYRIDTYEVQVSSDRILLFFNIPATIYSKIQGMIGTGSVLSADALRYVTESVRSIADETQGGYIMMSTGQKQVIQSASLWGSSALAMLFPKAALITAADGDEDDLAAINAMQNTDQFTIEMDWGDEPSGLSGGDAAELVKDFFGIVKDGDTVKVVTEDGGEEVVEPVELATEQEVKDINDDVMGALYGYGKVTVTIHALMRTGAETTQDLASVVYVDPSKTWAENGFPTLYDDEGTAIDTTTNPSEGDEVYLYQITQNS
jgi:hypothetical protein